VAGTSARFQGGRAKRPVQPGRGVVRDADREGGVFRRYAQRPDRRYIARRTVSHCAIYSENRPAPAVHSDAAAGKEQDGAISELGKSADVARTVQAADR